ncbi:MAG TPA: helix-hairpin-helix domain-containing protein [Bryobacteraceae bacterium]|jgi:competence protein ComEA|nr:helix-hairpin-helix domain-containing protein [Bryobacteraceae bacterium]
MSFRLSKALFFFITLIAAASAAWAQLPDGAGKDVTMQVCSKCHDVSVVTDYHLNSQGWSEKITQMINQGAEATDQQFSVILDYLVKNFGPAKPVNVNKSTSKELETQLEITSKEADAIVKYRDSNGAYKDLGDFKKVPDLNFKKIEAKKDLLVF